MASGVYLGGFLFMLIAQHARIDCMCLSLPFHAKPSVNTVLYHVQALHSKQSTGEDTSESSK